MHQKRLGTTDVNYPFISQIYMVSCHWHWRSALYDCGPRN